MAVTAGQLAVAIAAAILTLILVRWARRRGRHFDRDRFRAALRMSTGAADRFAREALRRAERAARAGGGLAAAEAGLAAGRVRRTHFAGAEADPAERARLADAAAGDLAGALRVAERERPRAAREFVHLQMALLGAIAAEAGQLEAAAPGRGGAGVAERSAAAARQRRQEEAAAASEGADLPPGRAAVADRYIAASKTHRSDSQNTHDSSVAAGYAGLFARLRAERGEIPGGGRPADALVAEIGAHVARAGLSDEAKRRAARALAQVAADAGIRNEGLERGFPSFLGPRSPVGPVHRLGVTDAEAFALVWERADHPRNAANRAAIRDAVVEGLANAVSDASGNVVCNHGRAENAGGALATLDFDPANTSIMTFEQHRNEVFDRARRAIEEAAQAAAAAADSSAGFAAAARSYCADASAAEAGAALDPAEEARFAAHAGARIDAAVDGYVAEHPGAVPAHLAAQLRADARAALVL